MEVVHCALAAARHAIATSLVRDRAFIPERLGNVTLRPAQRDAAARLASLVALHGGAMLAEPVGLGKTFTALAAASSMTRSSLLIVAPAALRGMWTNALGECGMQAAIVTHESLSRGVMPPADRRAHV